MNILDAIRSRRAVKHFDPAHRMSMAEQRELLESAMQAPTAFNLQHWRFVVVEDPQLRQSVRKAAWDQAQVTDASLLLVLCADMASWRREPARYWHQAPQPVQEFMLPAIDAYYRDKAQVQRDEAMRSCGIAAQTIMLAAQALGYDSCPMDGFDFDAVGRLIQLPEEHLIALMIVVGKKTKDVWPKPGQLSYEDVVIQNRF
jgi:nitroreductase